MRRRVAWVAALLAAQGCAFSGIDLVQDERIALTGLKDGQTVTVPFTLTWEVRKDIAPGHQVSYAVFVDRTVIRSGRTVKSVVPADDHRCQADAACPDADYLARRGVYVVSTPSATIPRLTTKKERSAHRVTVVILVDGRRDGEGAFSRTVYVDGES